MSEPGASFLARLSAVEARLQALAHVRNPGLTGADAKTGERWDAGQVWAHLAEFIPYWIAQAEGVIAACTAEPVRFGRTKTNPDRVDAIERDRHIGANALWQMVHEDINDLRAFLSELPEHGWRALGRHETRGVMPMSRIIEEFLVGHVEEHATQLEDIRGAG